VAAEELVVLVLMLKLAQEEMELQPTAVSYWLQDTELRLQYLHHRIQLYRVEWHILQVVEVVVQELHLDQVEVED
jgi:hypothetical protein